MAELASAARAAGAWTVVDGVSWAPHEISDVAALGCDAYLFSLYKVYGVHQGIMVTRRPFADALENQAHYFNAGYPEKRLNPAGPDHAQVAASAGTLDYVEALAVHHGVEANDLAGRTRAVCALWRAHEVALTAPLLRFLHGHPRARLIGPAEADARRAPTVAFMPERLAPQEVEAKLAERGIGVGASDFYARRLVERLGLDPEVGVVRASMVHTTSGQEVSALIEALEDVL